ncbi:hypothetical protein L6303_00260 [archaeon]|nr:hypothetical protein [archaeon]
MNVGVFLSRVLLIAIALTLFIPSAAHAAVSATMNQIIYVWGDSMAVSGTVEGTTDSVSVSFAIKNASGTIATITATSAGGTKNTFLISAPINDTFASGEYNATLLSGTDSIDMRFKVFSQSLFMDSYPVKSGEGILDITTENEVNDSNSDAFGGNFTELIDLSLSHKVYYGNYTIGAKTYHFVLVDQTNISTYDRLYVDDDVNFALYNDTEDNATQSDVEYHALKKSSIFTNGVFKYVVGEMERATGKKVVLWEPASGKTTYDKGDNITFIVLTENATHMIDESVKIEIYNSTGQNVTAEYTESSQGGWLNFTIDGGDLPPGTYTVKINDSLDTLSFTVESFKMFATIADTSNNPAYSFSPNSKVRLIITSKNSSGPFNLTSFTASFTYPNGTAITKAKAAFTQSVDGIYTYDYDLSGATGRYSVSVTGLDASNTQTVTTGFEVQSVGFEAQAVNLQYIDEAESGGAMVNAFSPNKNVTIITFLSNITAGGITAKGPGDMMTGLVTPENCNTSVTMSIRDENGVSYDAAYRVFNLSAAMEYLNQTDSEQGPPEQMLTQCMIVFAAPNKTGSTFKADIKMKYNSEEKYSGVTFGIQRLFARGSTVDFKGDDFSFLAPNSTVRIKLKVTDLSTDTALDGDKITSGKIIELYKVFPSYKDVLGNSTLRDTLNATISNGTLIFNSPNDEGAYMMKFRFTANVSGVTETGIGNAFFMLKKYMVWGQLYGAQQGQWFVKQGQNATLQVTVMDINDAQTVFGGQKSQKTCTGCTGFEITATQIRNDQQFKVHNLGDYQVLKGIIINSTNPVANLTIVPGPNMQPGWYSVDIIVTDSLTNATYFGWGGFEIRNFWVDARRAYWDENNVSGYSMLDMMDGGMGGETYGVNSSVELVVIAREPNSFSPEGKPLSTPPVLESIASSKTWPPVPISGYTYKVSNRTVTVCKVMDEGSPMCFGNFSAYVINISGLPDKQADYMANVRVNVSGVTDVGTFRFGTSSYRANSDYRRDSFPPMFATSENLTINFTGITITIGNEKAGAHNLTNVTVQELFSPKLGRPIKMKYGQNYTTDCNLTNDEGQYCQISVNLSNLPSGEYNARFAVVDSPEAEAKIEEIFFKIQGTIIAIPSIEEAWVWESDTVSKKVDNDVRRAEWSWCQDAKTTAVLGAYRFCGDYNIPCEGMCQSQQFNLTVKNVSYTKEIFGYISLTGDKSWMFGDSQAVNKERMCVYANGTHLWINSTDDESDNVTLCDLTQTVPIITTENFTDSAGGQWRLDAIGDQSITLTGLNTLYGTGALINTSYSRSGIIKFGQIWENNLGAYTQQGRKGIDLNNDGNPTNGTVYFAIADSAVSGVYDTFFFSTDGNFSDPISANDANRSNREFGKGLSKDKLTLLSIDSRGQRLKFYSKQIGDWAHMGDIKIGNNITLPVIVTSPSGTEENALVSLTAFKNTRTWRLTQITLVSDVNITGVGELRFNSSDLGPTGDYSFGIETNSGDKLEEWKWPMATVRGFLVDGEVGEAVYINTFKQLPLTWKNWDSGIVRIQQDRRNSTPGYIVDGVLANAHEIPSNVCTFSNATDTNASASIDPNEIKILMDDNNGPAVHFMYNITEQKLYMNASLPCHFNVSDLGAGYSAGDSLIISKYGRNYNVSVLTVDNNLYNDNSNLWNVFISNNDTWTPFPNSNVYNVNIVQNAITGMPLPSDQYDWNSTHFKLTINESYNTGEYNITYQYYGRSWRADFGVAGVNSSVIMPMVNNTGNLHWGLEWGYMQNVSIFGQYYDVILANDTYNYTRCMFESSGDGMCVKKAWIVPTSIGNFSSPEVRNVTFGQNFTSDLYIASVGSRDGDGIIVGNFSALNASYPLPAIGGLQLADNTTSYFAVLNESALGYDLDKNGNKNNTFYALAFDSDFNNQQNLTSILIDDDVQLLPWSFRVGETETQIDFDSEESFNVNNTLSRINEMWNGLPSGISNGNARFGEDYNDTMWENQPNWDVPFYNGTHMLLKKSKWSISPAQPVDVLLKVFTFNQEPLSGANISVNVARSTFTGFQRLEELTHFTVERTFNTTDSYGYELIKIIPNGSWVPAQYQIVAEVQTALGNETFERWFNVGF